MRNLFKRLRRNERGSSAMEFAIAGPVAISMILGVIQIGLVMQARSAMQSAIGDISRYAVVQYLTNNNLTDAQIQSQLVARATGSPYLLNHERLNVFTETQEDSGMDGIKRIDLKLDYSVPSIIPFTKSGFSMSVDKAVYVKD